MSPRDFAFWAKSLRGQQAKQKKFFFFFFNENVRALKDALEHLNAGESTLRRFLTGILSKNSKFLKAREIIRLWTKRAWNHCLISLVSNWLRLSISRKIPDNVPGLYRPTFHPAFGKQSRYRQSKHLILRKLSEATFRESRAIKGVHNQHSWFMIFP